MAVALAGCGGGGSSSSSSSTTVPIAPATTTICKAGQTSTAANPCSSTADVTKAITAAWTKFFAGTTPLDQRIALIAGGQKYAAILKKLGVNPIATKTSATVSNVTVTGPTQATVTFTVSLAGLPVLSNVKGTAVLQNGAWLVDPASLCKLLTQVGSAPAACSSLG